LARNFFPLDKLPQWSRKNNPGQMELILKAALEKKTLFDYIKGGFLISKTYAFSMV
jgi:hypothetical protein